MQVRTLYNSGALRRDHGTRITSFLVAVVVVVVVVGITPNSRANPTSIVQQQEQHH